MEKTFFSSGLGLGIKTFGKMAYLKIKYFPRLTQ